MIEWQRVRFPPLRRGEVASEGGQRGIPLSSGKGKRHKGYPSVSLTADSSPLWRGANTFRFLIATLWNKSSSTQGEAGRRFAVNATAASEPGGPPPTGGLRCNLNHKDQPLTAQSAVSPRVKGEALVTRSVSGCSPPARAGRFPCCARCACASGLRSPPDRAFRRGSPARDAPDERRRGDPPWRWRGRRSG